MEDENKFRVGIIVEGGVAHPWFIPLGVQVEIHDYDVEGCDEQELETDEKGDLFRKAVYLSCPEDLSEEEKNVEYVRTWECPDCGWKAAVSYSQLAEVGNPICDQCDVEMELV